MSMHRMFANLGLGALAIGAAWIAPGTATADQVIPDDLIVQGSTCVGLDCVNNESFGFDTIKLKENNMRIFFQDTSVGTFPNNSWRLIANDYFSGGASYFAIQDATAVRNVVSVAAGAPEHSLFVSKTGNVGLGTSTPVLELHVNSMETPAIRLEQNAGGGYTPQTWDIAGNEANFFVRDLTNGSRLPFRIRPGAPTSSIDVSATGNVGVGTASPAYKMHVGGTLFASGNIYFGAGLSAQPASQTVCYGTSPADYMGFCSSDIRLKRDISYLSGDSGLSAIMQIKPATFKWHDGDDRTMAGFIAQDVQRAIPAAVTHPRGSEYLGLDTGAVLSYAVRAIQELKIDNDKLRAEIALLKASR